MKTRSAFLFMALLALSSIGSLAQAPPPDAAVVLNHLSSRYRALQSYKSTDTWTRKLGEKDLTATVSLAAERPNRLLLAVKGDKVNTVIQSDGTDLIALRPDRKAYTKTRAPLRLMGSDFIGRVDVPSPAARLITILLENGLFSSQDPVAKDFASARVTESKGVLTKRSYILTFHYDAETDARVVITANDYLVRQVSLLHGEEPQVTEYVDNVEVDKPIAAETFAQALPPGAILVSSLPPLPKVEVASGGPLAPDFTAEAYGGGSVSLSEFRGRVVVVDFWATWCGPCQVSMPHVESVWRSVKGQDVVVLGVCVWDDKDAYEQWIPANHNKYTFRFAFDPAGKDTNNSIATKLFGVDGIPTTMVIDKEGHIAAKIVGYAEGDHQLEDALRKLGVSVNGL